MSNFVMSQSTAELHATEYKAIPGQINVDEAQGIVECFVAGIGNKDSVGDVCLPGAFTASLKRRKPRVVWGHNWNEPIGKVLDIYEVGPNDPRLPMKMRSAGIGGLYARVQFNLKSERGREAFNNVVFFGEEQEWSIGYKTLDAVFDPTQQANLLKEVELYEVSPVLHGANQLTGTISIKSDQPLKNPKGGLTAAGRRHFNRTEGANLKPGVKGPADTPQKMRRKGSFLTRFFTNPSGPMTDDKGRPTRLALSAAAWGEPVPKNMEDAAKLAAKGRRLLERYQKTKEKSLEDFEDFEDFEDLEDFEDFEDFEETDIKRYEPSVVAPRNLDKPISEAQLIPGDEDSEYQKGHFGNEFSASSTSMGRMADLSKALSALFYSPVHIRMADKDMVVFDIFNGEQKTTMRVTYYFDGERFMFGEPTKVRPEVVYLPVDGPSGMVPGHSFTPKPAEKPSGAFIQARQGLREKPHGGCGCGCDGGGSCKPPQMSGGPARRMFFMVNPMEKSDGLDALFSVCDYYDIDIKEADQGFVIEDIDSLNDDAFEAIENVVSNFGNFEEKAIGKKLRGGARMATERFDANAIDGDNDGKVQEGSPFERPAKPRNMPKVNPIKVPRREEVPAPTPPRRVPSTPAPTRTPEPSKPQKVPAKLSGQMYIPPRDSQGRPIPGKPWSPPKPYDPDEKPRRDFPAEERLRRERAIEESKKKPSRFDIDRSIKREKILRDLERFGKDGIRPEDIALLTPEELKYYGIPSRERYIPDFPSPRGPDPEKEGPLAINSSVNEWMRAEMRRSGDSLQRFERRSGGGKPKTRPNPSRGSSGKLSGRMRSDGNEPEKRVASATRMRVNTEKNSSVSNAFYVPETGNLHIVDNDGQEMVMEGVDYDLLKEASVAGLPEEMIARLEKSSKRVVGKRKKPKNRGFERGMDINKNTERPKTNEELRKMSRRASEERFRQARDQYGINDEKSAFSVYVFEDEPQEIVTKSLYAHVGGDGDVMSIEIDPRYFNETVEMLNPVFEYHEIEPIFNGSEIIIEDADVLNRSSINAINNVINGVNTNLK